jgi:hypothetical protein
LTENGRITEVTRSTTFRWMQEKRPPASFFADWPKKPIVLSWAIPLTSRERREDNLVPV